MSDFTLTAIERLLDAKLEPIKTGMAKLATSGEMAILSAKIDEVKAAIDTIRPRLIPSSRTPAIGKWK